MLQSRIILISLILITVLPATATADTKNGCKDLNKSDVIKWIEKIKEYELTAKLKMKGALIDFESRIYGRTPDRLRVDMDMGDDQNRITQKTIFDGTYQWSEASSAMGSQITKLQLNKTTNKNKPFDTFMYMLGSGLINGEDLPMTLKTLFDIYKVSAKCDKKNKMVNFGGPLDKGKYNKYISDSKYAKQRKLGSDKYAENFAYAQISVNPVTHEVTAYNMGKSADNITFRVEFENMKINNKLPTDIFNYKTPDGAQAVDITDDLVKKLQ